MITALRDMKIIEGESDGMVVYAGGDDFLALSPIRSSTQVVVKTRRHYSLGDSAASRGFYRLGEGVFPSLGLASRSYVVLYGHYKYPVSHLLALSHEELEDRAKESSIVKPKQFKKDTLSLVYSPRGGGTRSEALIPLKQSCSNYSYFVEKLDEIARHIQDERLTRSLLYDLVREMETIKAASERPSVLEMLLKRIVSRNLGRRATDPHALERDVTRVFAELANWRIDVGRKATRTWEEEKEQETERHVIEEFVHGILGYISALRG